jgi:hypothetical protein
MMTIFSSETIGEPKRIPAMAIALSLAGFLPFAGLTLLLFTAAPSSATVSLVLAALIGYGAVILSFLGGIRWGATLGERNSSAQALALSVSIIPAIVGWAAVLLLSARGQAFAPLSLLIAGFVTQGLWDLVGARSGALPQWFARLRLPLTLAVTVCLIAAAILVPESLR